LRNGVQVQLGKGAPVTLTGKASMRYAFENLSGEQFQQLCQALLARGNPGVQCFPIWQPDGGRDAIARDMSSASGRFLVYQVKFVREPAAIKNPRKWLLDIAEREIKKVRALVNRGATGYFLLTNLAGSGHLDAGSIDKMSALLQNQLDLPSICWWRDDIERRLDDASDIRWAYAKVMTEPDFLRAIVEAGRQNDRERQVTAFQRSHRAHDQRRASIAPSPGARSLTAERALEILEETDAHRRGMLVGLKQQLRKRGWTEIQEIPGGVDLSARRGGKRVLMEARNFSPGQELHQVRFALSQLLDFRFYYGSPDDGLCLVTDVPISEGRMRLLSELGVGTLRFSGNELTACELNGAALMN
jgi:hypothetical protein